MDKQKPFIRIARISMHSLSKHQLIHSENGSKHQLASCIVCGAKPKFANHQEIFWTATLVRPDTENDVMNEVILDYCCNNEECLKHFSAKALNEYSKRLHKEMKKIQDSIELIEKEKSDIKTIFCRA